VSAPSQRLDRRRRLLRAREYRRVFEQPCRSRTEAFTVLARDNGTGVPRLGLAIARKHVPGATRRNRVKRLIRESFRTHQHLLGGLDVVVLGRVGLDGQETAAICASLDRHWKDLSQRCRCSSSG
jgi:ribonuclease P protein component